jgi:hypothetical protein
VVLGGERDVGRAVAFQQRHISEGVQDDGRSTDDRILASAPKTAAAMKKALSQ